MTEHEFLAKWNEEKAMYLAWGDLVVKIIIDGLKCGNTPSFNALDVSQDVKDKILRTIKLDNYEIIRNIPKPRLKDDYSLLQKAFYREKKYSEPYNDISDKVGCRFVVLYSEQIQEIETIINHYPLWINSKDFDYRISREELGNELGYQSVHYIVRANKDMQVKNNNSVVTIKNGTPCEIQIRTLLQHAYSEVSHDTFYKNKLVTESSRSRISMMNVVSFIDAAESKFREVLDDYIACASPKKRINSQLVLDYWDNVGLSSLEQCGINDTIIGTFSDNLEEGWELNFKKFYIDNPDFIKCIQEHASSYILFKQPSILLVYYLAVSNKDILIDKWPFNQDMIELIMNDVIKK
jgi:ppGpp synthetase/RelA/SpoT-type nucleotidyltranferase